MPLPTYPSIPLPNQSLSSKIVSSVVRTEMEGGLARQIPRFSTGQKTYSCEWTFTGEEYAEFQEFFYTTLSNGTEWFEISLPTEAGFDLLKLRFVGGEISDQYQTFDVWTVRATLESEVFQTIDAPVTAPLPVWFRPEREILIDTVIDERFVNNLLLCAPGTGETLKITVPEIATPSDWLPFGIINKGPGNVLITVNEPETPPDPSGTWMAKAAAMGAWGIYRFDTGVTLDVSDRVISVADLSANNNDLTDTHATTAKRAQIVSGWIRSNAVDLSSFRGFFADAPLGEYHVLAVQRIPLPITSGELITTQQEVTPGGPWTSIGTFLPGGVPNWKFAINDTGSGSGTDKGLPTSGVMPRLIEILSFTSEDVNFIVDGYAIEARRAVVAPAMNCLSFGGRYAKTSAMNVDTAAVVVFNSNTNFDTPEGRLDLATLRKMMIDDFS